MIYKHKRFFYNNNKEFKKFTIYNNIFYNGDIGHVNVNKTKSKSKKRKKKKKKNFWI